MVSKAERKKQKQAKRQAWLQTDAGLATVPQPRPKAPPKPKPAPQKRSYDDDAGAAGGGAPSQPEPKAAHPAAASEPPPPSAAAEPPPPSAKRSADDGGEGSAFRSGPKRPKIVAAELGAHEVYVKSLPKDSSEDSVLGFFKESRPLGVKLGRDRQTDEFRGYAFLSFGSEIMANRCIEEWDGAWMGEANVELSHAASNRSGAAVAARAIAGAGRGAGRGGDRGRGRGGDRGGRGGRGDKPTGNPNKADVWPGDWTCPSCGANVYGSLDICYKPWCKSAKPTNAVETMTGDILDAPPPAEVIAANKLELARRVPTSIACEADASDEQRAARAEWLTRQIATFASQKQLGQAVTMYDTLLEEKLAPSVYTYSNLINAHVNSGDLRGARRVFKQLIDAGFAPNVVVFTTLLKGHSVSGDVARAEQLFDTMAQQVPPVTPDTRFINTFLRGCLRVGDAPRASHTYQLMREEWGIAPDFVAYKLVGRLLSQNLKIERLRGLVEEAEMMAGGTAAPQNAALCMFWAKGKCDRGSNCGFWHDPSIVQINASKTAIEQLDTSAHLQLSLAHAEALLGNWDAAAAAVEKADQAQQSGVAAASDGADEGKPKESGEFEDEGDATGGGSLFSRTARSEMGLEIARVRQFIFTHEAGDAPPSLGGFLGRLFVFSSRLAAEEALDDTGGGSDDENEKEVKEKGATKEERKAARKARKAAKKEKEAVEAAGKVQTKKGVGAVIVGALQRTCGLDAYTQREVTVEKAVEKQAKRCLTDDGRLKWKRVFADDVEAGEREDVDSRPVKIEICSGSGEWAAAQAVAEKGCARWVAMELRHDRVYDCFSRMLTGGLKNLAVIGGDAAQVLPSYVADGSVAHICVNFPEPPQRTGAGAETAENHNHLLTTEFFTVMHASLKERGGLTIFSDNYKYMKLLARTVASVRGQGEQKSLLSDAVGERLFKSVTPRGFNGSSELIDGMSLHHGVPDAEAGHAANVTSYFDRFWENGNKRERYFIHVRKWTIE